jgi:hypothetical protein
VIVGAINSGAQGWLYQVAALSHRYAVGSTNVATSIVEPNRR